MEFHHCEVDDDMLSCSTTTNKTNAAEARVTPHLGAYICEFESMEHSGDFDPCGDFDEFFETNTFDKMSLFSEYQRQEQLQASSDNGLLDGLKYYDIPSPTIQTCLDEFNRLTGVSTDIQEVDMSSERNTRPFLSASLEILNRYKGGLKWMRDGLRVSNLSTVDVIKIAGENFIQSSKSRDADGNLSVHPSDYYIHGYTEEVTRNVQLTMNLLVAAEKVGARKYGDAMKFLDQCDGLSSAFGNPVERIVHHFSGALWEKIDRETGSVSEKGLGMKLTIDIDAEIMKASIPVLAGHQQIPFFQLQQLCTMQTIMENATESKKIHVIDLGIRNGSQWVMLMQALTARRENPIELLKITAIGTFSPELIEETGRRLEVFAKDLKLPFSFNIIMLSDMIDLTEELIELHEEETVVVYAQFLLRSLIPQPDRLESVISVIKNINPIMMIVAEVEANLNSPAFGARFIDALFYYSAFFDSLEECMKRDNESRKFTECVLFKKAIRTIVAAEGKDRTERHVKLDVWRAFFHHHNLVEVDLGVSCLCQATMVKSILSCAKSCMVKMDGKSLVIGWKDTPICFLSAWKFQETSELV